MNISTISQIHTPFLESRIRTLRETFKQQSIANPDDPQLPELLTQLDQTQCLLIKTTALNTLQAAISVFDESVSTFLIDPQTAAAAFPFSKETAETLTTQMVNLYNQLYTGQNNGR